VTVNQSAVRALADASEVTGLPKDNFEVREIMKAGIPGAPPLVHKAQNMSLLPLNELPELFPHVVAWIKALDQRAAESGRILTEIETRLARSVGVNRPNDIRVLVVDNILLPDHPRIRQLAQEIELLTANTGGLTAIRGVIARSDCANNLRILVHEFVHVEQYERLGTEGFLREYILQLSSYGYLNSPFEQEAEAKATKACLDAGI
jgi:hypothetical protein